MSAGSKILNYSAWKIKENHGHRERLLGRQRPIPLTATEAETIYSRSDLWATFQHSYARSAHCEAGNMHCLWKFYLFRCIFVYSFYAKMALQALKSKLNQSIYPVPLISGGNMSNWIIIDTKAIIIITMPVVVLMSSLLSLASLSMLSISLLFLYYNYCCNYSFNNNNSKQKSRTLKEWSK